MEAMWKKEVNNYSRSCSFFVGGIRHATATAIGCCCSATNFHLPLACWPAGNHFGMRLHRSRSFLPLAGLALHVYTHLLHKISHPPTPELSTHRRLTRRHQRCLIFFRGPSDYWGETFQTDFHCRPTRSPSRLSF